MARVWSAVRSREVSANSIELSPLMTNFSPQCSLFSVVS